jgi:hypothetical protein
MHQYNTRSKAPKASASPSVILPAVVKKPRGKKQPSLVSALVPPQSAPSLSSVIAPAAVKQPRGKKLPSSFSMVGHPAPPGYHPIEPIIRNQIANQLPHSQHHLHYNVDSYAGNIPDEVIALDHPHYVGNSSINLLSPSHPIHPNIIVNGGTTTAMNTTNTMMPHHSIIPRHYLSNHNDARFIWHNPLFLCDNIPRYGTVCLCPCTALSEIMEKLLDLNEKNTYRGYDSTPSISQICFSLCACSFAPALSLCAQGGTLYRGIAVLLGVGSPSTTKEGEGEYEEDDDFLEDEVIASCCPCFQSSQRGSDRRKRSSTSSSPSNFFDYIFYSGDHNHNATPSQLDAKSGYENYPCYFLSCLFLGSMCFIPATFAIRQITSEKYRDKQYQYKESYWTSGLVSCFAWPCGLVQVLDEIRAQEHE